MIWRSLITALFVSFATVSAQAQINITEWMYAGANGEFIEFTNMSGSPVNMAGWFYSDADQQEDDLDLSAFGTLAPGESALLTDATDAAFRAAWGLEPSVKIISENMNSNLGRVDEINLFHMGSLIDRLTYGDNRDEEDEPIGAPETAGSIRTQNRSGNPNSLAALGVNNVFLWEFASSSGTDQFGSVTSSGMDRGNPGHFYLAVPEPGSAVLTLLGLVGLVVRRRGR